MFEYFFMWVKIQMVDFESMLTKSSKNLKTLKGDYLISSTFWEV